jgi:putative restriction endonuclease
VVSTKGYDLGAGEGRRIWEDCQARALDLQLRAEPHRGGPSVAAESHAAYGTPQLVLPRLGQGTFRVAVTSSYGGDCAVSGEHSMPALEGAHIRRYADAGSHAVPNGLLLRADILRLFDAGYVTVTPDFHFAVSKRLAEEWENGKAYYALHGKRIEIPGKRGDRPDAELLRWHSETVFERGAA